MYIHKSAMELFVIFAGKVSGMKNYSLILAGFFILLVSCDHTQPGGKLSREEKKEYTVKVLRYDNALFSLSPDNLIPGLKAMQKDYAFFLSADLNDTANIRQIHDYLTDSRNRDFYKEVRKQFPDLSNLEVGLTGAFSKIAKQFPGWKEPRVYAYMSGGMYDKPVIYADTVLLIALDLYLGKGFLPYHRDLVPEYRMKRMSASAILPDVAYTISGSLLQAQKSRPSTMLDYMILEGKKLCFLDAVLPDVADNVKIGYPGTKMEWARENESQVWASIIGNKLLYTRNGELIGKFMVDGPFTSGFPQDSPARLGAWIGWRIVKAYLENNDTITLKELFANGNSQSILAQSGYKPAQ